MLGRDEDVVNSDWLDHTLLSFFVLNDNLRLAIWSQPWDLAILSLDGHDLAKLVGEDVRVWMEDLLIPLIGGISEHKSLISSSHISLILGLVNSGGNVGILGVHVNNDLAVVAVETDILAGETNLSADLSGNLLEVDLILIDRDFSEKNDLKKGRKLEYFE